jgi:hypothetical protein
VFWTIAIPAVRAFTRNVLTVPDATLTLVPLDEERFDTANMHDNAVNNTRLTVPRDGIYAVSAHVSWWNSPTGVRELNIFAYKSYTLSRIGSSRVDAAQAWHTAQSVTTVDRFSTGDYVEMEVRQESGGPGFLQVSGEDSPYFSMAWLGSDKTTGPWKIILPWIDARIIRKQES